MHYKGISHTGKIVSIDPSTTRVQIVSDQACGSCAAKSMCEMSSEAEKIISIPTDPFEFFSEGDEVNVILERSMGFKAVWICYMIPLVILMVVILVLNVVQGEEIVTGLGAIASVALYYFVIWLLRSRLRTSVAFRIEKISDGTVSGSQKEN